jgi:molecular chaperone HtpG
MAIKQEKKEFTAEVSRLLQMLTHSIYSNREIFLRELISNASDACDKLRYISSTKSDVKIDDLKIDVVLDSKKKSLTIFDNGIGMSRDEMIENLGTIAKSGTKAFIENAEESKDLGTQIGQFGIGFYSAFIVSKNVQVISTKYDADETYSWDSDGLGSYNISKIDKSEKKGTSIIIMLDKDSKEFLEKEKIQQIVSKYSDNINFPIYLRDITSEQEEQINTSNAIWTKQKKDISAEQYQEHYQLVSRNFDAPISTIHYKAEGRYEYDVLLYIPTSRPFDLFDQQRKAKLKLYVKRVLISDDSNIIPSYFRFISGVIDCADIPLTVSREILQENQVVVAIKKAIKNRIINTLKKMSEKEYEQYNSIWKTFGTVIKEGLYEDFEKRDELLKLLRFSSTINKDGTRSLDEYIKNIKEQQKSIYYITAEDYESALANPILEGFKAREIEVIILTDPVDSFWVASNINYEKYDLKQVSHAKDELMEVEIKNKGKEKKSKSKVEESSISELINRISKILDGQVSDVKVNPGLIESPVCLSLGESGYDKTIQRILQEKQGVELSKPVLEINPEHNLIRILSSKIKDKKIKDVNTLTNLLYDYALIMDGEKPSDIANFSKNMQEALSKIK